MKCIRPPGVIILILKCSIAGNNAGKSFWEHGWRSVLAHLNKDIPSQNIAELSHHCNGYNGESFYWKMSSSPTHLLTGNIQLRTKLNVRVQKAISVLSYTSVLMGMLGFSCIMFIVLVIYRLTIFLLLSFCLHYGQTLPPPPLRCFEIELLFSILHLINILDMLSFTTFISLCYLSQYSE